MSATILQSASPVVATTRRSTFVITGRVLTSIALVLMAFDVSMKLGGVKEALEGTAQLGFSTSMVLPLGLIQLACLILHIIPRTAPLGATLLTAYLGGAVAIHVQRGDPMFTHILSPVYFAIVLWAGLYLRDPRVRAALGSTR